MNMRLLGLRDARTAHLALVKGAATDLDTTVTHRCCDPARTSLYLSLPRSIRSSKRFVVDLPANQLGPGWKKRA
jgi:hypothetical protein